jgi:hypothetical protein
LLNKKASVANTLLLLSQTQAKSAIALKRVLKLQPKILATLKSSTGYGSEEIISSLSATTTTTTTTSSQKDRLRATLRGALNTHHQTEADMSESTFLGNVTSQPSSNVVTVPVTGHQSGSNQKVTDTTKSSISDNQNPVDEMMELERELRAMDMALEMGNSIASLGTSRNQAFMKNSISDGSFMVVPAGSNSYMSSSVVWGTATSAAAIPQHQISGRPNHITTNSNNYHHPNNTNTSMNGPRSRANRLQSVGSRQQISNGAQHQQQYQQLILPPPPGTKGFPSGHHPPQQPVTQNISGGGSGSGSAGGGLESSWWGNNSTTSASQILSSSVISMAGGDTHGGFGHGNLNNTKQLMRLMDSLKTLGDENAALLREVEEAESARMEAKAAKEQMRLFKEEYTQRFATLKEALEKFRKGYPASDSTAATSGEAIVNPVSTSEFVRSASASDQIQRQEQLIRKLTVDLKKEKDESKKKDAALRKYESFYREVKARSAQKTAQRQVALLEKTTAATPNANLYQQQHPKSRMAGGLPAATPRANGYRLPRA